MYCIYVASLLEGQVLDSPSTDRQKEEHLYVRVSRRAHYSSSARLPHQDPPSFYIRSLSAGHV